MISRFDTNAVHSSGDEGWCGRVDVHEFLVCKAGTQPGLRRDETTSRYRMLQTTLRVCKETETT